MTKITLGDKEKEMANDTLSIPKPKITASGAVATLTSGAVVTSILTDPALLAMVPMPLWVILAGKILLPELRGMVQAWRNRGGE